MPKPADGDWHDSYFVSMLDRITFWGFALRRNPFCESVAEPPKTYCCFDGSPHTMIKRRSFLQGLLHSSLGLPMTAAIAGCGQQPRGLRVRLLSQSVPVQVASAFQRSLKPSFPTDFSSEARLDQIFQSLQNWQNTDLAKRSPGWFNRPSSIPDVVTLGDAWLRDAIRQELIQPWQIDSLEGWKTLDDRFQQLVRRNAQGMPDDRGEIWGLPYRWGSTAIAYRQDFFKPLGWEPTDWVDLWRPELIGQIGLIDDPREVMGLILKSLGQSYNEPNPEALPEVADRFRALQPQVKFYSSTHLVQPLLLKDVAVVVGWSTDLLPLPSLDRQIKVILPQSGTALWADLWVRPRKADAAGLERVQTWVNFCWQAEMVPQFARFGAGTSPQASGSPSPETDPVRYPDSAIFDRSEFIYPLAENDRS